MVKVKVFLVDDHEIVRRGVMAAIELVDAGYGALGVRETYESSTHLSQFV